MLHIFFFFEKWFRYCRFHISIVLLVKLLVRLDVSGLAGGDGLFRFDWGSQADAERTFTVRFKSLAEKHDWKWTIRKPEVKYRGAECPYCGAVYSYTEEHFNEDGTISCQNCLKQFKP